MKHVVTCVTAIHVWARGTDVDTRDKPAPNGMLVIEYLHPAAPFHEAARLAGEAGGTRRAQP